MTAAGRSRTAATDIDAALDIFGAACLVLAALALACLLISLAF